MRKLFLYLKNHRDSHNPLLKEFLIIYPAITAFFSVEIAILMVVIMTILYIAVRSTKHLYLNFFPEYIAFVLTVLFVITYAIAIFLIINAVIPSQLRIIILPIAFLLVASIIDAKSTLTANTYNSLESIIDGILYFLKGTFFVVSIYLFSLLQIEYNKLAFSIFAYTITYLVYNFIVYKLNILFDNKVLNEE